MDSFTTKTDKIFLLRDSIFDSLYLIKFTDEKGTERKVYCFSAEELQSSRYPNIQEGKEYLWTNSYIGEYITRAILKSKIKPCGVFIYDDKKEDFSLSVIEDIFEKLLRVTSSEDLEEGWFFTAPHCVLFKKCNICKDILLMRGKCHQHQIKIEVLKNHISLLASINIRHIYEEDDKKREILIEEHAILAETSDKIEVLYLGCNMSERTGKKIKKHLRLYCILYPRQKAIVLDKCADCGCYLEKRGRCFYHWSERS